MLVVVKSLQLTPESLGPGRPQLSPLASDYLAQAQPLAPLVMEITYIYILTYILTFHDIESNNKQKQDFLVMLYLLQGGQ